MEIKFSEVLTPGLLLSKLTTIMHDLQALGLSEMTDVRVQLRPGTVANQYLIPLPGEEHVDITAIEVEPGSVKDGARTWSPLGSERSVTQRATDSKTFEDLVVEHWDRIDICGGLSTLSGSDDPAVLITRLLRLLIALTTDTAGVVAGVNKETVSAPDVPQPILGGKSFWEATLDDDGFMAIFTRVLFEETADEITTKRRVTLTSFPAVWRMPLPGVRQDLKDDLIRDLSDIVGSRVRAASLIALQPLRFAKPLIPANSGQPAVSGEKLTLLEALFAATNRAEIVHAEVDGYRRERDKKAAGKRAR